MSSVSATKFLVKLLATSVLACSGLSFGWLIYATISAEYPEFSQEAAVLLAGLLYLPTLIAAFWAFRINFNAFPVSILLHRGLWLLGFSFWGGLLGLAISLGGLEDIMPALIPVTAVLMAGLYLVGVFLILGSFPRKTTLRWFFVSANLLLLTLTPVLFEFFSRLGGYQGRNALNQRTRDRLGLTQQLNQILPEGCNRFIHQFKSKDEG